MAAPYYKQKLPTVDFGELNPKQKQFCQARSRYVGYGGHYHPHAKNDPC